MFISIWKGCPEMDRIMNLEDAKELIKDSEVIQKFIEYTSQNLSRIISAKLYNAIKTTADKSHKFEFHASSVESYAKNYEEENNCILRLTEDISERIALRIVELFKESGFCALGYIAPNDRECVRIEISGWE